MARTTREEPVWYVPQSRAGLRLRCTLRKKSGDSVEILITGTGFLRLRDIFIYTESDFLPEDQSLELARAVERPPHMFLFGQRTLSRTQTTSLTKATSEVFWGDVVDVWSVFPRDGYSDKWNRVISDDRNRVFYGLGHSRELYLCVPRDMIGSLSAPPAWETLLRGAKKVRLRIMVTHNKLVVLGGPNFYKTMGVSWQPRTSDQSSMLFMNEGVDSDEDDDGDGDIDGDLESIRRRMLRLLND